MSTIKAVAAGIGIVAGIAIVAFIIIFGLKFMSALDKIQNAKDNADIARLTAELVDVRASLARKDSTAVRTSVLFSTAKTSQAKKPVVTGGGPRADSIANAAVNACFVLAQDALTACQQARITADSVPILRDSISTIEKRLLNPKKWTAKGGLYYVYPERGAMARVETQLELLRFLKADVGIEHSFSRMLPDSLRTKYYIGGSIPFR